MKKQEIVIQTVPVTIKVIEVGGKKMTISVFNQIPSNARFWIVSPDYILEDAFIGWVKHNGNQFILFSEFGILYKYGVPEKVKKDYENYLQPQNQIYIGI